MQRLYLLARRIIYPIACRLGRLIALNTHIIYTEERDDRTLHLIGFRSHVYIYVHAYKYWLNIIIIGALCCHYRTSHKINSRSVIGVLITLPFLSFAVSRSNDPSSRVLGSVCSEYPEICHDFQLFQPNNPFTSPSFRSLFHDGWLQIKTTRYS